MAVGESFSARQGRVHLRLLGYKPLHEPMPENHLRLVIQVVEPNGVPIAEDPIFEEAVPEADFWALLDGSRAEGWDIRPWQNAELNTRKPSVQEDQTHAA